MSVTITGIDSLPTLQQAFDILRNFEPLTDAERRSILERTAKAAQNGRAELYKTTQHFDSTAAHPEWLG